ncbi:MAG: ATP-binding protein [Actinomycetota bacterium]|nr:ATP-binding protein [Actinomycetota bacterium]
MRRIISGTRGRLALFAMAILTVALLVADGFVLFTVAATTGGDSDRVLVNQARALSSSVDDFNGRVTIDLQGQSAETLGGVAVDAALVSRNGIDSQTGAQPMKESVLRGIADRARAGHAVWADVVDTHGVARRVYAERLDSQGSAVIVVSRSVEEMQNSLARTLLVLALVGAALIAAGGGLAYWLAGRALRPVRMIAGLARSLGERDLHRRVDVKVPPDELGELVDTFNAMLTRLEAAFESQGRFTADASHELRAPLTLMRSEIEGALTRTRSRDEYVRVLTGLQAEVIHLSRLADQLLMLARADAGALTPSTEMVDVADFIHETVARWAPSSQAKSVSIDVEAPASGLVRADPALLRRVMDNLLDNAVRFAPPNTSVRVTARGLPAGWEFEVADKGPGVGEAERKILFTRFGRLDTARTPNSAGAGLGLALAAAIARAHGGTLDLADAGKPGATFRLFLPGRVEGTQSRKPANGRRRIPAAAAPNIPTTR